MLQKHMGYIFILLALLELSLLPILSSVGASNVGAVPLLFLIFLTASLTSFVMLILKKRLHAFLDILSNKKALVTIISAGLLNFAVAQLFLTYGVLGTNPIVTSLVLKLWPIFMALMLPFALKTKTNSGQLAALFVGFVGVFILVTNGTLTISGSATLALPFAFLIVSILSTSVSNVIIRSHNYDMYAQIFLFNISSFALLAMLLILGGNYSEFARISGYGIFSALFLGSITYCIGSFMFFYSLKVLNPIFTGNATYATPFLTILFSVVFLGTALYWYYFVALLFILIALSIQHKYITKAQEYSNDKNKNPETLFDVTGAFVNNKGIEVSSLISGDGRALAVKMGNVNQVNLDTTLRVNSCIIFSSNKPHSEVLQEEIDFVNDIIGTKNSELALIGIGNVKDIENIFAEIFGKAQ